MSPIGLRSEDLILIQIIIQQDACYHTIGDLGDLGVLQFKDLNSTQNAFQRNFIKEIRMGDEILRKLRFFEEEMIKAKICESAEESLLAHDCIQLHSLPELTEIARIDSYLSQIESEIRSLISNESNLQKKYLELVEMKNAMMQSLKLYEEMESSGSYSTITGTTTNNTGRRNNSLFGNSINNHGAGARDEEVSLLIHNYSSTSSNLPPNSANTYDQDSHLEEPLTMDPTVVGLRLGFITGVIREEKYNVFEKVLWRGCRGNVFIKNYPITDRLIDPQSGELISKRVFVVLAQGSALSLKIRKICAGFGATLFDLDPMLGIDDNNDFINTNQNSSGFVRSKKITLLNIEKEIDEISELLAKTHDYKIQLLLRISTDYEQSYIKTKKMMATFLNMNKLNFNTSQSALVGEAWCPKDRYDDIQRSIVNSSALKQSFTSSNSSDYTSNQSSSPMPGFIGGSPAIINELIIKRKKDIPTYFRTNKFTDAYQNIISAYGIASYKEINPSLFTIITFPFLFAVMFGDVGHGILMALFAGVIIFKEKDIAKAKGELTGMVFSGRYLILLMGLFSLYIGLLYNDIFSKPLTLFSSGYKLPQNVYSGSLSLNPTHIVSDTLTCPDGCGFDKGNAYMFGMDSTWSISTNKLTFQNSLKMKISVLLGVSHMLFGTFLSFLNYTYNNDKLSIYTVFVPEVIFMVSIFGYLAFCIILKWLSPFEKVKEINILLMLINMVLDPLGDIQYPLFPGQKITQNLLLVLALVCVPWLLFAKPYFLYKRHQTQVRHRFIASTDTESHGSFIGDEDLMDMESLVSYNDLASRSSNYHSQNTVNTHQSHHGDTEAAGGLDEEEEFDFSEIFVHQTIHTIEYCLGAVSNTASYLRLWALSLAHAQLSEVLWNMILKPALISTNPSSFIRGSILAFSFFFWAVLTLSVLLGMEAMSAFLHALRLHWVEFQGKFYKAEGTQFLPFDFNTILHITESG